MINAAKADGQIDKGEIQRIVGSSRRSGVDEESGIISDGNAEAMETRGSSRGPRQSRARRGVVRASLMAIEVIRPRTNSIWRSSRRGWASTRRRSAGP